MKKIVIKVPKVNVLKETKEGRKERVNQAGSSMITHIIPDKRLDKKKQRQSDKKYIERWI